ncbi:MAG TPA: dephospho-CoA kinase, partial [Terriglobales bacterium]|nr:dephospho-CoA kinase [Terriglobales bacterium]
MSTQQPQHPQPEWLVIGITGRIGSGKTSAARYFEQVHGFQYVRYSHVLAEWLAPDPDSKARLQQIGWEVMSGGMQGELNRRLITRLSPGRDCVVDGLRHPVDFESLQEAYQSQFCLLYVDCSAQKRWERLAVKHSTFDRFQA